MTFPGRNVLRKTTRILATALLVGMVVTAGSASAQTQCRPHEAAVEELSAQFGTEPVAVGIAGRGATVVELFVDEQGGWALLATRTNGASCLIGSGNSWTDIEPLAGEQAADLDIEAGERTPESPV